MAQVPLCPPAQLTFDPILISAFQKISLKVKLSRTWPVNSINIESGIYFCCIKVQSRAKARQYSSLPWALLQGIFWEICNTTLDPKNQASVVDEKRFLRPSNMWPFVPSYQKIWRLVLSLTALHNWWESRIHVNDTKSLSPFRFVFFGKHLKSNDWVINYDLTNIIDVEKDMVISLFWSECYYQAAAAIF